MGKALLTAEDIVLLGKVVKTLGSALTEQKLLLEIDGLKAALARAVVFCEKCKDTGTHDHDGVCTHCAGQSVYGQDLLLAAEGDLRVLRADISEVTSAVAEGGWVSGLGTSDPRHEGPTLKDAAAVIREYYAFREKVWDDDDAREAALASSRP